MKVIVLGAGASKPAGLPLSRELADELRSWLRTDPPELQMWEALERERIFGTDDFELDLTRLDYELLRRERNGESAVLRNENVDVPLPSYRWLLLPEAVQSLLLTRQIEAAREPSRLEYLRRFLGRHVSPGDTIITFNFDCLPEALLHELGLWELRDGYGIDLIREYPDLRECHGPSPVEILKLHGSVGWFSGVNADRLIISMQTAAALGYPGLESIRVHVLSGIQHRALLPSYIKSFSSYPLPVLWRKAARAIAQAERIAFIGYSFPEADAAARILFITHCRPGQQLRFFWRSRNALQQIFGLVRQFGRAGLELRDRRGTIEELAEKSDLWSDEPRETDTQLTRTVDGDEAEKT